MTLAKFTVERGRADSASREKTAAQRLMVQTLLSLTEVRDAETGRHSRRTQQYARLLAEQLATQPDFRVYLTRERIDLLSSLAPLHDIGKVGVSDHVLNKPGALTPGELAEMREHPTLGRNVILKAEARSHDPKFRGQIVAAIEKAFKNAVKEIKSSEGKRGSVRFDGRLDYEAFLIDPKHECVQLAEAAVAAIGREPVRAVSNGGLDANWLNAHGIPTVTLGCGQMNVHTTSEMLDLAAFRDACRTALLLATNS